MFNVRIAGDLLYTWLSLVMSLMVSYFVLSFSHEISLLRPGTELSQFLRIFLHTLMTLLCHYLCEVRYTR